MSQEDLHNLLQKLVNTNMAADAMLQNYKQLDKEYINLKKAVGEIIKTKKSFDSARELLKKLISQNKFNETIQSYDYPKRILGGNIDLDSNKQKHAIDELSVTLNENEKIPKSVLEITAALKKYYSQYFKNSSLPPRDDPDKIRKLNEFESDPNRGASIEYKQYLNYYKLLVAAEKSESNFESILKESFSLSTEMHAERLIVSENNEFKKFLLCNTQWEPQHSEKLELIFSTENDEGLLEIILSILKDNCQHVNPEFLNDQIKDIAEPDLFIDFLSDFDHDETEDLMNVCIQQNHHFLLNLLININGFDQNYFYLSLSRHGIHRDVFKTMIDSLFVTGSPQSVYGMDGSYAEKVISTQKKIPINVVTTLQKALPRGFEGSALAGYFQFMTIFNQQISSLKNVYGDQHSDVKDTNYCEHMLKISDTEAIRFIMFTYIFDAIKNGIYPDKIGMSRTRINELIAEQYRFEKEIGHNVHIKNHIADLFILFPDFDIRVRAS